MLHAHTSDDRPDGCACRDLITEFVAQADAADSTRVKYRAHLVEFLAWLNHPHVSDGSPHVALIDASPAHVHRFMNYLRGDERFAATADARVKPQLSPSSRKSWLATLRSFYRFCVSVQLATIDPTLSVRSPKVTVTPGLRLTAAELRTLVDAPGTARDRIQTCLMAFTAARSGELRRLRWSDIDFLGRTIALHGKGGGFRELDIHPQLMTELRRWLIYQHEDASRHQAIRLAKAHPDSDFVLLTRNGKPLASNAIAKQLKSRAIRAGIHTRISPSGHVQTAVSPHALRRSFASLLLNNGHHIDAVADVLGHASIDTTRKHYAFSSTARRKATIEGFTI